MPVPPRTIMRRHYANASLPTGPGPGAGPDLFPTPIPGNRPRYGEPNPREVQQAWDVMYGTPTPAPSATPIRLPTPTNPFRYTAPTNVNLPNEPWPTPSYSATPSGQIDFPTSTPSYTSVPTSYPSDRFLDPTFSEASTGGTNIPGFGGNLLLGNTPGLGINRYDAGNGMTYLYDADWHYLGTENVNPDPGRQQYQPVDTYRSVDPSNPAPPEEQWQTVDTYRYPDESAPEPTQGPTSPDYPTIAGTEGEEWFGSATRARRPTYSPFNSLARLPQSLSVVGSRVPTYQTFGGNTQENASVQITNPGGAVAWYTNPSSRENEGFSTTPIWRNDHWHDYKVGSQSGGSGSGSQLGAKAT